MAKWSVPKRFFKSHFFVVAVVIFLVIFLIGFFKAFWKDWQIRREIKQMEDSRAQLEQKKIKILDYLKEAESDIYAEKEARLHFGLAQPGETEVIIMEETKMVSSTVAEEEQKAKENDISNIKKWWFYFFR